MSGKKIKAYFEIKNNDLFYRRLRDEGTKVAHILKLEGKWKLSGGNLIFDVSESYNTVFGQSIKFSAKAEKTSKNFIQFRILKRTTPRLLKRTSLKLTGRWRVDSFNNLIFDVQRGDAFDEIIFGNNWQVTKENNILLLYKRKFLKKEITSSLVLSGNWGFGKHKLTFTLSGSARRLEFDISLAPGAMVIKQDKIHLTIGVKGSVKTISLYGRCRYFDDGFEFTLNPGKPFIWIFKLNKRLSGNKELIFELTGKSSKIPGLQITLSKKLTSGGRLFMRAKLSREKRIEAGLYLPF